MVKHFNVIIVNWNTQNLLADCIQSFLNSGIDEQEIIVVDQSSSDNSVECTRQKYPHVKIIVNPSNDGYGKAINLGIEHTSGAYIIACNADIKIKKISYDKIQKIFEMNPKIALIGPKIFNLDGKNVTRFSKTGLLRGSSLEFIPNNLRGAWRDYENKKRSQDVFRDVSYIEGAFFIIRKASFESIGCFDEGIIFFHEDADLPIRFRKSGYRVVYYHDIEIIHIGSASFSKVPIIHAFHFYKNLIRLYQRHALRRAVWLKRMLVLINSFKKTWLTVKIFLFRRALNYEKYRRCLERYSAISKALLLSPQHQHTVETNENKMEGHWVTVVIPTKNRPDCVRNLLAKLNEQSYIHFDVLVIDQSDNSFRYDYASLNNKNYELKIIYSDCSNRSNAKNIGIKGAKGGIVLFCDDDIVPQNDLIQAHVDTHMDQNIGGVSCRVIENGLPPIKSTRICKITWYGEMIGGYNSDVSCDVGTLVGGNMSIKKNVLKEVGYFDSIYGGTSIFEEQDYSSRISALGYRICFTNKSLAEHYPQASGNYRTKESNPSWFYHIFHQNEIIYFLKNRNHFFITFVMIFCFFRSIKQMYCFKLTLYDALYMYYGVFRGMQKYYFSLSK